jgi:activator of 2-hydroxyglutaryl-CoA dehydratase
VTRDSREILWSDYQRHETRQPETVLDCMVRIGEAFPDLRPKTAGASSPAAAPGPIASRSTAQVCAGGERRHLGRGALHPDVGSVIELGGQDAKIIMFRERTTGLRPGREDRPHLDERQVRLGHRRHHRQVLDQGGMDSATLRKPRFDPTKLHHVAAKCGVFAETDIVNLVKSGIPAPEIMNSLADAIVHQNLSGAHPRQHLTPQGAAARRAQHLPAFLVECWRLRIPETWESRGLRPKEEPIES